MSDVEKGHSSVVNGGGNIYAPRPSRIGNPGALYVSLGPLVAEQIIISIFFSYSGLFSFASTTFILSMYNVQTRGIKEPNAVVGMAAFCGGLAQLLAGMWEFPRGNVFGATGG